MSLKDTVEGIEVGVNAMNLAENSPRTVSSFITDFLATSVGTEKLQSLIIQANHAINNNVTYSTCGECEDCENGDDCHNEDYVEYKPVVILNYLPFFEEVRMSMHD